MAKAKQYILVYRKKGSKGRWKKAGPYVYAHKSQFGSLVKIRRDNLGYEYQIIDRNYSIAMLH